MNTRLLILPLSLLFAAPAAAQNDDSPLSPLFGCRQITDNAQRLACLDGAVEQLYQSENTGDIVAVNRSDIEAAEEATYGLSIPQFRLPGIPSIGLPSFSGGASSDIAEAADTEATETEARRVVRNDTGDITGIDGLAIRDIGRDSFDRLIITLQNGQVWRQIDDTRVLISRRQSPEEMFIAVRSGALASHQMQLNGRGRWFRVRREE